MSGKHEHWRFEYSRKSDYVKCADCGEEIPLSVMLAMYTSMWAKWKNAQGVYELASRYHDELRNIKEEPMVKIGNCYYRIQQIAAMETINEMINKKDEERHYPCGFTDLELKWLLNKLDGVWENAIEKIVAKSVVEKLKHSASNGGLSL